MIVKTALLAIALGSLFSCQRPTAAPRVGPPAPRFHDSARGVSFDPPGPPFQASSSTSPRSVAHFSDRSTRAGIHVLCFPSDGAVSGKEALAARAQAYRRGLSESVAGLEVLAERPLERFGMAGVELEYEGGAGEVSMRSVDWLLYAPGLVYVVKVTAPKARYAEIVIPLLASRATLIITPTAAVAPTVR